MAEQRELTVARNVTLYPRHWDAAFRVSKEHDYDSLSAGLRRIVNEWLVIKGTDASVEREVPA